MTKTSTKSQPAHGKAPSFNVGLELADTTWRMAVPVLLFAGLGLFIDKKIGSAPWLTLLGTLVGFVFAALLIKQQIGRGRKQDGK